MKECGFTGIGTRDVEYTLVPWTGPLPLVEADSSTLLPKWLEQLTKADIDSLEGSVAKWATAARRLKAAKLALPRFCFFTFLHSRGRVARFMYIQVIFTLFLNDYLPF